MLNETLVEFFEKAIKEYWDLPSLSDYEVRTLKYSEVGKKILKIRRFFEEIGVERGDKISVSGKNSINWVLTYICAVSYGAVIVPILSDFSPQDIQNTVSHSDSKLLLADTNIANQLKASEMKDLLAIISLENLDFIYTKNDSIVEAWKKAEKYYNEDLADMTADKFEIPYKIGNEDIAAIIYTSGTTGFSKGVMLPLNSLSANVKYAHDNFYFPSGATIVSFLPLAHCFGAAFDFLFPFTKGGHIHFLGRIPSPQILIDAFEQVKPILVFSVPLVIEKIYKTRIKKVLRKPVVRVVTKIPILNNIFYGIIRKQILKSFGGNVGMIVVGGAAFDPEIEKFMKRIKLPVSVGYGMTECGPLISYESWETHKPASCGRIITYLESKIDSPEPRKIIGELLVRGENVMLGYYKNDMATEDVLEKDGWMHTGDLGTIDDDGFLFLKGRLKNMILGPSGQNIYPEEMEAKLNNMPFILESIVMDDDKHRIHALIYPDKDSMKRDGIPEEDLYKKVQENIDTLNKQLPEYSQIHKFKVLNRSFKRTPTQKIIRHLYKDELK